MYLHMLQTMCLVHESLKVNVVTQRPGKSPVTAKAPQWAAF